MVDYEFCPNYECFPNHDSFYVNPEGVNSEGQLVADLLHCDEDQRVAWADLGPRWTGSDPMWETPVSKISELSNWLEDAWVSDPQLDNLAREPEIFDDRTEFAPEIKRSEEEAENLPRSEPYPEELRQKRKRGHQERATSKLPRTQETEERATAKQPRKRERAPKIQQENKRPDVVLPHPNSYQLGFWNTVPVMTTDDSVPTIIPLLVMNGKTKTSEYFRTAKLFCARYPNQWKLRGDAQFDFGDAKTWHNARGSLKGEPMANTKSDAWPQVRNGCAPPQNSFVMARFGGEWYMMNWTI
jgi:hypothetical protein